MQHNIRAANQVASLISLPEKEALSQGFGLAGGVCNMVIGKSIFSVFAILNKYCPF